MVLPGQSCIIFTGWVTGIILVRKPTGRPKLPSWLTWAWILPVVNILLITFFTVDSLVNWRHELLSRFTVQDTQVISFLSSVSLLEQFVSNVLLRFVFLLSAKKLSKIWCYLYHLNENNLRRSKSYMGGGKVLTFSLLFTTIIVSTGISALDGIFLAKYYDKSWLYHIGGWFYQILLIITFNAAFTLPFSLAVATLVITHYLIGKSFGGVCKQIHNLMRLVSTTRAEPEDEHTPTSSLLRQEVYRKAVPIELKQEIHQSLQEIQEVFKIAKGSLSLPAMETLVLAGGSHRLVSLFLKIFMRTEDTYWEPMLVKDVLHLGIAVGQLLTLQLITGGALCKIVSFFVTLTQHF